MDESDKELIFIYNAKSDLGSLVKDTVHKVIRPSTFPCNLAAVTFGPLGMKSSWKKLVENFPVPTRFLYKDEFKEKFEKPDVEFPCAYLKENGDLRQFMSSNLFSGVDSVEELKNVVYQQMIEFDL
jgi:hypothetical protein